MKKKHGIRLLVTCTLILSLLSGCGQSASQGGSKGVTEITFYASITSENSAVHEEMVKRYNETQGKTDGVRVNYKARPYGYDSNLATVFASKRPPDVLIIEEQNVKSYSKKGYLYDIQKLVNNTDLVTKNANGEVNLDLTKIPSIMLDRFRINWENNTTNFPDDDLYAIPDGANPTFIYYNIDAFDAAGFNIISVAEEDLDDYNKTNGTSYLPHGYAEYSPNAAPAKGLKTSTNLEGKSVIKVFNNQISMNWAELVAASKYLTQSYNPKSVSQYGYMSEWWFPHGWSVGGDCMRWDSKTNHYVFSLGDTIPGYLAVSDTTVNGHEYKAGTLLKDEDSRFLSENPKQVTNAVYALPSQYDAFAEYCALSQEKGRSVDLAGKRGYGISPSPAKLGSYGRAQFFTAQNVAMLVEAMYSMPSIQVSIGNRFKWDIAPVPQYREYENGDTDANGNLKIIGEGGYTGKLKTVNGTPITGDLACSAKNFCFIIPSAAPNAEAAWKFIQWAAGPEAQEILSSCNYQLPNYQETALSDSFLNSKDRPCSNFRIAVKAATYGRIGDWSYLEDGQWVTYWANILNTDVRNGNMLLDEFFNDKTVTEYANTNLAQYNIRIGGK